MLLQARNNVIFIITIFYTIYILYYLCYWCPVHQVKLCVVVFNAPASRFYHRNLSSFFCSFDTQLHHLLIFLHVPWSNKGLFYGVRVYYGLVSERQIPPLCSNLQKKMSVTWFRHKFPPNHDIFLNCQSYHFKETSRVCAKSGRCSVFSKISHSDHELSLIPASFMKKKGIP